ncbi:hypothetical protein EDD21DRAFT_377781 [Dissophora ornata]|nr:hypothetical protein EDD21DRAFT_377781 [Dissophora ornata]
MPSFALSWSHRHHMFVNLLALPFFLTLALSSCVDGGNMPSPRKTSYCHYPSTSSSSSSTTFQDKRSLSFLLHSALMRCTILSVSVVSFFTTHAQMQTINGLSPWTVSLIDVDSDGCLFVVADSIEQIAKIDPLPLNRSGDRLDSFTSRVTRR